MLDGFPNTSPDFEAWSEDLGGRACYGMDGPYNSCGDGFGDEFMGHPPEESGACVDQRVGGLPFAPSVEQRTADAISVVGGECFTDIDRDVLTLSDCRLPHIGKAVWGRATDSDPDVDLAGVCDANRESWEGFGITRLIQTGPVLACVVLRSDEAG